MFRNINVDLEITPAQECLRPNVPQQWRENCQQPGKLDEHHRVKKIPRRIETKCRNELPEAVSSEQQLPEDDWDDDWQPTPARSSPDSQPVEDWGHPVKPTTYDARHPATWGDDELEWFEQTHIRMQSSVAPVDEPRHPSPADEAPPPKRSSPPPPPPSTRFPPRSTTLLQGQCRPQAQLGSLWWDWWEQRGWMDFEDSNASEEPSLEADPEVNQPADDDEPDEGFDEPDVDQEE
jgi:hypothetical protein